MRILVMSLDHNTAPAKPKIPAKTKDERMLPITVPIFTLPLLSPSKKAKENTIHNTSVPADSKIKTVRVLSVSCKFLTKGMTTAEDVPPKMAPNKRALIISMPKAMPTKAARNMATKKPANDKDMVCFQAECKTCKESEVPLSKRITTKVTATNTEPPTPKLSGPAQ